MFLHRGFVLVMGDTQLHKRFDELKPVERANVFALISERDYRNREANAVIIDYIVNITLHQKEDTIKFFELMNFQVEKDLP